MERIVASYRVEGHQVDVVELVDEDVAWYQLAVDTQLLPPEIQPVHGTGETEVGTIVRDWLARQG
jgi:hypothetical protein